MMSQQSQLLAVTFKWFFGIQDVQCFFSLEHTSGLLTLQVRRFRQLKLQPSLHKCVEREARKVLSQEVTQLPVPPMAKWVCLLRVSVCTYVRACMFA